MPSRTKKKKEEEEPESTLGKNILVCVVGGFLFWHFIKTREDLASFVVVCCGFGTCYLMKDKTSIWLFLAIFFGLVLLVANTVSWLTGIDVLTLLGWGANGFIFLLTALFAQPEG